LVERFKAIEPLIEWRQKPNPTSIHRHQARLFLDLFFRSLRQKSMSFYAPHDHSQ